MRRRAIALPALAWQVRRLGVGMMCALTCSRRCCTTADSGSAHAAPLTPRAAFKVLGFRRHLHETKDEAARRVKRCFIEATLQCHPDLFPNDATATQRFQTLSDALRVALTFAATKANGHADDDVDGAGVTTAQSTASAFSTLQRAVEEHVAQAQAQEGAPASVSAPRRGNPSVSSANASLEDVTAICRSETLAGARLRTLVDELPAVLCGKDVQLFEVFCFHPPRFSQRMAAFALRFSKDLPIIVRRVVKRRPQVIHKRHHSGFKDAAAFGAGSGDGARDKAIEDMIMKPLVLVGALLFVENERIARKWNLALDPAREQVSNDDDGTKAQQSGDSGATEAHPPGEDNDAMHDRVVAAGKPLIACGADVQCCAELRCVLYDTDSLSTIVDKISAWEARGFQRLQLELATGRALSVLSSMLHLVAGTTALALHHDLTIPFHKAQSIALTAQHLVCALCLFADVEPSLVATDDAAAHTAVNTLVASIRQRVEGLDAEAVKGGIQLLMPKTPAEWSAQLVHTLHGVPSPGDAAPDPPPQGKVQEASDGAGATTSPPSDSKRFHVTRHPSACEATDLLFSISVPLQKDLVVFLTAIDNALERVDSLYQGATDVLPQLVHWRDQVVGEEWRPILPDPVAPAADNAVDARTEDSGAVGDGVGDAGSMQRGQGTDVNLWDTELPWMMRDMDEATPSVRNAPFSGGGVAQRHVRRDGVKCVARVFNMLAADECVLWSRLYEHRQYLADHQRLIASSLNIFFDCLPYDPGTAGIGGGGRSEREQDDATRRETLGHHGGGGWCGEARDGGDLVVLTRDELSDSGAFLHWLQEVVEQSSIAKECARRLRDEGIEYIEREPSLPISHFLSFIALYTSASGVAARNLIEAMADAPRQPQQRAAPGRSVSADRKGPRRSLSVEDVGFSMVVSCSTCDIRDGGRLLVPWYFDPSHLVALLEDADRQASRIPMIG